MNEDNRLERRLEQFYEQVPPPPQGLKAGRERFLAQAARLPKERPFAGARVQAKPRRRKMKLALAYKIVAAVLAVVMGTAALGGGVAYAASDSLPGEPLYPVKLAAEDVRLAFSAGPAARAQLGMAFAAERVREMQQLAQRGEPIPGTVPTRMAQHMEQTMAQVTKARPEDVPALLEQVMAQTRAQKQFLEQVQAKGAQGSQAAFQRALESAQRAYETASAAQGDPNRYQQEYQYRYQGQPGPHGTATPQQQQQKQKQGDGGQQSPGQGQQGQGQGPGQGGGQQNRVQNQEQNNTVTPTVTPQQHQEQNREQNGSGTPTVTPQQHQEQNREQNGSGTPTVTPQQHQEQNQEQNGDGSAGSPSQNQHQEQNNTVTPTVTPAQNQHQERNNTVTPTMTPQQNQEQNGSGGAGK
jgi:hypothetical protein